MKLINFHIDELQLAELKKLPGTMAEHLRLAVYEYLNKQQNASSSPSVITYEMKKGGEEDV